MHHSSEKIIFLDFDGPLVNQRTYLAFPDFVQNFDPVTIRALNIICQEVGAKVVCSSSWAYNSDPAWKSIRPLFEEVGFDLTYMHADWSCNYGSDMTRKEHILKWLGDHPEVRAYTIIDDEYVDIPDHLVLVSESDGMLTKDFELAAQHLGSRYSEILRAARMRVLGAAKLQPMLPGTDL